MKISLSGNPLPFQNLDFCTMVVTAHWRCGYLAHVNAALSGSTLPFSPLKALSHLEHLTIEFIINVPLIALSLTTKSHWEFLGPWKPHSTATIKKVWQTSASFALTHKSKLPSKIHRFELKKRLSSTYVLFKFHCSFSGAKEYQVQDFSILTPHSFFFFFSTTTSPQRF